MKKFIILILATSSFVYAAPAGSEDEVPLLQQATERIRSSKDKTERRDIELIAGQLKSVVQNRKFRPSSQAALTIQTSSQAALALVAHVNTIDKKNDKAQFNNVEEALTSYIEELSANIDDSWKFPAVHANVSPPAGTQNAISGMNPDAIQDPVKKKAYQDRIDENAKVAQKNAQQRELRNALNRILLQIGSAVTSSTPPWTKDEALERFGKRKGNRELIKQYIQ
jgi:hypothetical protein